MSQRVKVRQNVRKCLKAREMCVDDDENAISKKPPLLITQDTQHKLGVALSYLERNKGCFFSFSLRLFFSFLLKLFHSKDCKFPQVCFKKIGLDLHQTFLKPFTSRLQCFSSLQQSAAPNVVNVVLIICCTFIQVHFEFNSKLYLCSVFGLFVQGGNAILQYFHIFLCFDHFSNVQCS